MPLVPPYIPDHAPWKRWLGSGLGLLFPPLCAGCSGELPRESDTPVMLCQACRRTLLGHPRPACPRCGMPYQDLSGTFAECPTCRRQPPRFSAVISLGSYEGPLRRAVLRSKGVHEEPLAAALGELLWEVRGARFAELAPDIVVPVPMHWSRRFARGTNSPETIARVLAGHLRVPCHSRMLVRHRATEPQGPLPRPARARNVRRAFRHRKRFAVRARRILLVDDILTSGATAGAAARVLLRAGAEDVSVAIVARADGQVMNDA